MISNYSDLYVVGHHKVKSYSYSSKSWSDLPELSYGGGYSICTFMQKLFVICGENTSNYGRFKFYNKESDKWSNILAMNLNRFNAACTVFEGKIVVAGGWVHTNWGDNGEIVKSVEAYDHHENRWSYYPSMLKARSDHSAVSMDNKLFMISGLIKNNSCEVFDSFTRTFTFIKSHFGRIKNISPKHIVNKGKKIY